jgi:hypothetical protein
MNSQSLSYLHYPETPVSLHSPQGETDVWSPRGYDVTGVGGGEFALRLVPRQKADPLHWRSSSHTHVFCCLIIHNIEFRLELFLRKLVKICFIGVEDASIIQPGNRHGHDGICFIMVNDQETNAPIKKTRKRSYPSSHCK